MLAKTERLSRNLFTAVFSQGKRRHGEHFTIVYAPAVGFRASVVVSKKVAKKAHDRNRLKRQLYEYVRLVHKEHSLSGHFLIFAKPSIAKHSATKRLLTIKTELPGLLNPR